jgi:hypothetical protein
MVTKLRRGRQGQALLLVTLSLFAMCGLLGLAIDLGWSYFVKKSAQNAADAAALAAAYQALNSVGEQGPFTPEGAGDCDFGVNLKTGCQYAEQNDFNPGGHGGRQKINIQDGIGAVTRQDGTNLPSCGANPGLVGCVDYWVTVRTVETIPQLFSAVLGNTTGLSSARATAAAVQAIVNGSLITLNRRLDTGPNGTGIDIATQPVNAPSGIVPASDLAGTIPTNGMTGPIFARSPVANPGLPDGPEFLDPLRGYGQPPLQIAPPLSTYAVMGGVLTSTIYEVQGDKVVGILTLGGATTILPSGIYFPAQCTSQCTSNPIGAIAPVGGGLSIGPGGTVTFTNGAFGSFYFFGGLTVSGQMLMDPGEYVIVGGASLQVIGSNAGIANTGNVGAGEIIILTGSSSDFTFNSNGSAITGNVNGDLYPGLMTLINGPSNTNLALVQMAALRDALTFGPANIQISLGNAVSANPSGLNPATAPASLQPFGGIVLWQDQANSTVQYTAIGNIALCGNGIDNACPKTPVTPTSPQLTLPGTALGLTGTIYQPRGAWINVSSGAGLSGSLQIITGAVTGGKISISQPPTIPLRRRIVALIE